MVKKLLKYELIYYLRTFGMFLPIILVMGLITRLFMLFDSENIAGAIIKGSSIIMLLIASSALMVLAVVAAVVRFYKNMYSAEGYLTFTLPVTNSQHIFVKLAGAMICEVVCALTVILAWVIVIPGFDFYNESIIGDLLAFFEGFPHIFVIIFTLIIEYVLLMLVSMASTMLLYYACMTVGQLAKKNRILLAVGVYFAYYAVTQSASTIFGIVFALLETVGGFGVVTQFMTDNMVATLYIIGAIGIVLNAGVAVLFWFITQKIMTKKLNLE